MLSCFHTKPKKHFNAAAAGQVKLNCLHPKPMLDVPPAQCMEKWKRLVAFIDAAEGSVIMSRCADGAPLLGARWRMHTGGWCTWPSAISADALIYHPQPWIIVLLSLSPDASAQPEKKRKKWKECTLVSGEGKQNTPGFPRFTSTVIKTISCSQMCFDFFCLFHLLYNETLFGCTLRQEAITPKAHFCCLEQSGLFMMWEVYSS